jgi:hypothetical protein
VAHSGGASRGRVACAIDAALVETARPRWTIAVMATGGFVAAVMLFGFVVGAPLGAYYKANYQEAFTQEAFTIPSAGMAPTLRQGGVSVAASAAR